ncbi:probable Autophagy-related protein 22 [Cephalotrichum gorgonifer]|uniref:Autophagy-related protein n=1 Tax=Cephalotrichum gorgonifer TaxID=2041049 RepID=A0AAE8SQM6_9PEZI|nr:probable Autophagy-related protein 22 [Cephalotrichum gorgonifer]
MTEETPPADPAPRYAGEDTRPTSTKELAGWYMYAFAAETYVICGISSFIPILLESLARENGYLLSDPTQPCPSSTTSTTGEGSQCVVDVLGMKVNTASFAMYTFSVSVLLQALLVVSISCAADHGNYRKKLLLTFAWTGSLSVMCYMFITKANYLIGGLLAIISNTSFGASFVLLNSFLPLLVRWHPDLLVRVAKATGGGPSASESEDLGYVTDIEEVDEDSDPVASETSPLAGNGAARAGYPRRRRESDHELTSVELQLSSQISAKGMGIGYTAGLSVQCIGIIILLFMDGTTFAQRVVLFVIGLWWTVFTIPAAMWLRPRPGPPLPDRLVNGRGGARRWLSYLKYSWTSLFKTIQLARRLVDIILFLVAWFLLSDAIATTSSTAILFAKVELRMETWALGMINVILTLTGVLGAFSWAYISRRYNMRPGRIILICLALFELIPVYGLLGYLPFVKNWGLFGLQQPWEMYPLAAVYGLVLGGLGSYCRSLYGELIPPGSEAAFYALYAITDKGSSFFGPAIVAAIISETGDIRPAFWFLAALVGLPAPLMWLIDVDRGKREGAKLAEVIEGFKVEDAGGGDVDVDVDVDVDADRR